MNLFKYMYTVMSRRILTCSHNSQILNMKYKTKTWEKCYHIRSATDRPTDKVNYRNNLAEEEEEEGQFIAYIIAVIVSKLIYLVQ